MSKNTKKITYCAVFIAISALLGTLLTFYITPEIKVSLMPTVIMLSGAVFGPVTGGIVGGVADFIASMIKNSGGYNPIFTLTMALYGVLGGLMFYQKQTTILKTSLKVTLIQIICSALLNTLWQSIFYGTPFLVLLPLRLPGTLVLCIIYIIIMNFLLAYKSKIIKIEG